MLLLLIFPGSGQAGMATNSVCERTQLDVPEEYCETELGREKCEGCGRVEKHLSGCHTQVCVMGKRTVGAREGSGQDVYSGRRLMSDMLGGMR